MLVPARLLLIIDDSTLSPLPQSVMNPITSDEDEYICSLIQRLKTADTTSQAKFIPELGTEGNYGLGDPTQIADDELLLGMQQYFLEVMRTKTIELINCDFLFFHAREANDEYLGVFMLPYRVAPAHAFYRDDAGTRAEVIGSYHLPTHGANVPGMLINKTTSECWIHDVNVKSDGEKKRLFRDLLYSFEEKKTVREVVKAVEETVETITPNLPSKERTAIVKQALSDSIQDTGSIDLSFISDAIFPDEPAQAENFTRQIQESGVQEVTAVPSATAVSSLEKMRITTDSGVSISLPLSIAQDPNVFEIENQDDGSFSIILRNIQKINTK